MEKRKIIVLMLTLPVLLLTLAPVLNIAAVEVVWEYKGYYDNEIEVQVEATVEAYPGDEIDVVVTAEAQDDLEDVDMELWIEGTEDEGDERWESDEESVINEDLDDGDDVEEDYEFKIPTTADPGMILCHIVCEWDVEEEVDTDQYEWITHSFDVVFPMTYVPGAVTQAEYEELQEDYTDLQSLYTDTISELDKYKNDYTSLKSEHDSLTSDYDSLDSDYKALSSEKDLLQKEYDSLDSEHKSLQVDYDDLESDYNATAGQLSNYTTYTYILAIATVIFVVTTIIFATRRTQSI